MHTADSPIFGGHCYVTYGDSDKSTVSVSITPDEHSSGSLTAFGTLAYALPSKTRTVSSILTTRGDQAQVETATEVSQMLAAVLQKPVYVNTSLGGTNMMLLRSVKDFVTSLLDKNDK